MVETQVIYYMKGEDVPYLVKLNVAPENARLRDFKNIFKQRDKRNITVYYQTEIPGVIEFVNNCLFKW